MNKFSRTQFEESIETLRRLLQADPEVEELAEVDSVERVMQTGTPANEWELEFKEEAEKKQAKIDDKADADYEWIHDNDYLTE